MFSNWWGLTLHLSTITGLTICIQTHISLRIIVQIDRVSNEQVAYIYI